MTPKSFIELTALCLMAAACIPCAGEETIEVLILSLKRDEKLLHHYFLDEKAREPHRSKENTPLHMAAKKGSLTAVLTIFMNDFRRKIIDQKNENQETPLLVAARFLRKKMELLQTIPSGSAHYKNVRNRIQMYIEVIRQLLLNGANPAIKNAQDKSFIDFNRIYFSGMFNKILRQNYTQYPVPPVYLKDTETE